MNKSEQDKFVEKQGEEWSGVAVAWEKWDAWLDENMARCDELVLDRAKVAHGHSVLDLGSGTGYPALKAASIVKESGSVTGLDMAEEMLNVARRKADALDFKHVLFKKCDVSRLPFEDGSFDAVTSRFCLMFLPEPERAVNEVFRALKKGGSFAGVVWGAPDKNPGLTLAIGMLKKIMDVPAPDPSAPGLFSLAKPGDLKKMVSDAGFSDIKEEEIDIDWVYDSGQHFIDMLKDMAAPIKVMLEKLEPDQLAQYERKLIKAVEGYKVDGKMTLPGAALMVSGVKGEA
ncbi:hypothetical protein MNBD_NITROSPINAE04-1605 [hydrothermal vent metagenome]|uniref:Methyltransferase type 11 domain-containing protein n=1 Tax=hydrothermal vent metagenome TaxID=652676 RepID=A0A3B1CG45_9ZZZZ